MSKARRLLVSGLLAVAAIAEIHAAAAQSTPPPFPRLGAVLISGSVQSSFGTPSYQQLVAKVGVAVVGLYPGWSGGGFTANSAAAAVKALNPNIKLFPYTNIMELEPGVSSSGSAYSPVYSAVSASNWFLRTAWPNGSITDADGNAQLGLNPANGTYRAWRAVWSAANELTSNWDGVYLDNVFWQPRVSADYSQSGSAQSPSAAGQTWRDGYAAYVTLLKTALPGRYVIGNTADWANGPIPGYNQMLNGGVMESIIGQSYSYESEGWSQMMNAYKIIMNATAAPGYQIFDQDGSTTDYQGMRYGLASCLLDNAYYYHSNAGTTDTVPLYDEFNFNLGAPAAGPAGSATATYSNGGLTVYQNGVWRRDFVNGISLVNPKGNGTQTVTLETSYKHLSGTQAPSINNGQTVTTVTLNDRDGVILQRLTSQAVPDAPSLTVQ
ncbi:MAG TPA: putative glycoside hydrolase [Steroidobacteraceae bacterium]|nr:putative glycoside hydrolase [Steroidobacteraceae bacterium]